MPPGTEGAPRRRRAPRRQPDLKPGLELETDPVPPAETSAEPPSTALRETVEYEVTTRYEHWHIGEHVWLFEDDPRTAGLVAIGMIRRV